MSCSHTLTHTHMHACTLALQVKRCCSSHMCNTELSIEVYYPDQVLTTTLQPPSTTDTAPPTTTTEEDTVSVRTRIPPPILTPLTSTTEGIPMVTDELDNQLYCYCDGEDCIQDLVCRSAHTCGTEYTVESRSVTSERRRCISDQSECGKTDNNKYTACCVGTFCNEFPRYEEIPFELFSATPPPPTVASTTPTSATPTPQTVDEEFTLFVLTITLSVVAVLLLACIVSTTITCYVKRRREKLQLNISKKHTVSSVNNHPSCCQGNTYEDASRSSVQSSSISMEQHAPSKEQLMTSV